jgi:hypothetical protein
VHDGHTKIDANPSNGSTIIALRRGGRQTLKDDDPYIINKVY